MAASQTTAGTKPSAALGLLIFDGDCGFCTVAARKFADFAGESADIMPWQGLDLAEYGLTEQQCSAAVYWVEAGDHYRGADAVAKSLQVCSPAFRLLGKIMSVPPVSWLARGLYPLIAKYRYKLPGATNACRIN